MTDPPATDDSPPNAELATPPTTDTPAEPLEPRTEGIVFRSFLAGPNYVANLCAGVLVCAGMGWLVGRVMQHPTFWLIAGVFIALSGAFFGRRRGEWRPRTLVARGTEKRFTAELGLGRERSVSADAVRSVRYEAVGDADAAQAHWVVLEGPSAALACIRTRNALEAEQLVLDLRATLALAPSEPALPAAP